MQGIPRWAVPAWYNFVFRKMDLKGNLEFIHRAHKEKYR